MIFPPTAQPLQTLTGPTAPEAETLAPMMQTPAAPIDITYRGPVAPVVQLAPMTVSAGEEVARVPLVLSAVMSPFRRLFQGIGLRTTLVAPELQDSIQEAGGAVSRPVRQMNPPSQVLAPSPWYQQFTGYQ